MKKRIERVALAIFENLLACIEDRQRSRFKLLFSVKFEDEEKPLALIGFIDKEKEDGKVLALYNPDEMLVNEIHADCAYAPSHLKEIVAKKCDMMLELWISAYKPDGRKVGEINSYKNRAFSSARMVLK